MDLSITRKEFEDIKPHLKKTVTTFLGYREPSIVKTVMHSLSSGYDKCKTAGKLESPLLNLDKATSLTDKAFDLAKSMTMKVDNVHIANKRSNNFQNDGNIIKRKKEQVSAIFKEEAHSLEQDYYELDKKMKFEMKMREGTTRLLSASNQQMQSLQAAKSLLTSNKRMTAYTSELHRMNTEIPQVNCDDVGSKARVSLSDLRFPLMWRDTDHFKNKGDYRRFAAFCLAKIGTQLYDTNITFPVDRSMTDVTFNDVLIFENISTDFKLELELYAHVLRNDFSIASSPMKIKNTCKKLVATLRDESNGSKIHTNFELMGSAKLSLEEVSSRVHAYDMQIENTENRNDQLPLYGNFCCRLTARPYCISSKVYSGCVWLRDELSSSWASLQAFELSIWSTAEEAKYQPPQKIFKVDKTTKVCALKSKNEIEISNELEKRIVSLSFSVENYEEKGKWLKYLVQHTKDHNTWKNAAKNVMVVEKK